ncbi:hypothetical protein AQUCO_03400006v1 [Aquilegia coerulea]|uniref:Uncharacterized protein n=1 Tax=Aquilegia coerulea TaxID=218851 RepID=A0A2G5CX15_AQUCA|nr:hypothetical protein AQUCO_03400006v1 [Aquilegia coerulea]
MFLLYWSSNVSYADNLLFFCSSKERPTLGGIESMHIDGQPHRKPVRHFRTQRPNVSPMEVDTPCISGSQVPRFSHTISQSAYSPVRSTVPSVATNPHRPNECVSQSEHLASRPLVSCFVTGSTSATHHPGYGTTRPPPSPPVVAHSSVIPHLASGTTRPPPSPVAIHSSAAPHIASGTTHSPSVIGSSESFSPCVVQPSLGGGQQHPSVRAKRSAEFDAGDDVKSKKNRYEYSFKMEGESCSFQLQVNDDSGIVGISELLKKLVEYDKALSMKRKLKESFDTDGVCLLCKATQTILKIEGEDNQLIHLKGHS